MTKRISVIGSSSGAGTLPGWNDYEFAQFERSFLKEGVIQSVGGAFAISERGAGANMTVDVAAGRALIEITNTNLAHGKTYPVYFDSDAVENVTITTADATNPRIDIVTLKVDVSTDPDGSAGNIGTVVVVAGTPAGSPSAPAVPANSIKLAEVSVPASDTSITDSQITDSRTYVTLDTSDFADIVRTAGYTTDKSAIHDDTPVWLGTITGTNTLTGSVTPTKTAYAAGQRFAFIVANDNTGVVTLNVDSLGAKSVDDTAGNALTGEDLKANGVVVVRYNGTKFLLESPKHSSLVDKAQALHTEIADSTAVGSSDTTENNLDDNYVIPANSLAAGDVLMLQVPYAFTLQSGTCTLRVKLGSTVLGNVIINGVTGATFGVLNFTLQIRSIGASGSILGTGTNMASDGLEVFSGFTPQTINTTTNQTLQVSVQFSTNSASNGVNSKNFFVRKYLDA